MSQIKGFVALYFFWRIKLPLNTDFLKKLGWTPNNGSVCIASEHFLD